MANICADAMHTVPKKAIEVVAVITVVTEASEAIAASVTDMKFGAIVCLLFVALTGFHANTHAALGENTQAVASDAKGLRAVNMASKFVPFNATTSAYTRHEITLANGGVITEYSNSSGIIFAFSWQSTAGMPPIGALLGNYNAAYGRAQAQTRIGTGVARARSLHQLHATEGDWNIVSHANNNVFNGFSYLNSQLPLGFNLQTLAP